MATKPALVKLPVAASPRSLVHHLGFLLKGASNNHYSQAFSEMVWEMWKLGGAPWQNKPKLEKSSPRFLGNRKKKVLLSKSLCGKHFKLSSRSKELGEHFMKGEGHPDPCTFHSLLTLCCILYFEKKAFSVPIFWRECEAVDLNSRDLT